MREMKDSGIDWIGEIPKEWKIIRVRHLFKIGRGRVIAQTELNNMGKYAVYSSQTKNNGCMGFIDTYDFDIEQITWTTDGANAGTVFLRNGKHNCTNVCGTLQSLKNNINLIYQKYALDYIAFYYKREDTNGYKIMNNEMSRILTIYPPLETQHKIADYLDEKTSKIDYIISREKKVIEKLKEYKQSIITEKVTKGLNPNVKMKDSCVDWIGEIPENWRITRLLRLAKSEKYSMVDGPFGSDMKNEEYVDDGIPVVQLTNVKLYTHYTGSMKYVTEKKYKQLIRHTAYKGDIVIAKMMPAGRACILKDYYEKYVISADVIRFCVNNVSNKKYILYSLNTYCINECKLVSKGITRVRISLEIARKLKILAPSLKEQQEIVNYLDKKCELIEEIIIKKEILIEKLLSYKKSLIYEVVTGKREV